MFADASVAKDARFWTSLHPGYANTWSNSIPQFKFALRNLSRSILGRSLSLTDSCCYVVSVSTVANHFLVTFFFKLHLVDLIDFMPLLSFTFQPNNIVEWFFQLFYQFFHQHNVGHMVSKWPFWTADRNSAIVWRSFLFWTSCSRSTVL